MYLFTNTAPHSVIGFLWEINFHHSKVSLWSMLATIIPSFQAEVEKSIFIIKDS